MSGMLAALLLATSGSSQMNAAASPAAVPESVQLSLTLNPKSASTVALEATGCLASAAEIAPWHDASDAFFFATGPTARLDDQELWAGSLTPLVAGRYDGRMPHLVVLGVPLVIPLPRIGFSVTGWRPTRAPC